MTNFKSAAELEPVLKKFSAPELTFTGRKDAGPDEELYFFRDESGKNYCLWARDYISELAAEAGELRANFGIFVRQWLGRNDSNESIVEFRGDRYALAVID